MAVSALSRQSEDKIIRQAYQRRQDEIFYFNKSMAERDEYKQRAEQEKSRAEQAESKVEQAESRAKQSDAEIKNLRREIEILQAQLANR